MQKFVIIFLEAKMNKELLIDILSSEDITESILYNQSILLKIIPELKDMINFPHNHPHHHLDVWNHTLLALSYSNNDFEERLVLLLHDIGKPHSYQDKEVRHFHGHAEKSAEMAKTILRRLNFEEEEINEYCYLIKMHDTEITDEEIKENFELMKLRYHIQYADTYAHNPLYLEKRIKYLEKIENKLNSYRLKRTTNRKSNLI